MYYNTGYNLKYSATNLNNWIIVSFLYRYRKRINSKMKMELCVNKWISSFSLTVNLENISELTIS